MVTSAEDVVTSAKTLVISAEDILGGNKAADKEETVQINIEQENRFFFYSYSGSQAKFVYWSK